MTSDSGLKEVSGAIPPLRPDRRDKRKEGQKKEKKKKEDKKPAIPEGDVEDLIDHSKDEDNGKPLKIVDNKKDDNDKQEHLDLLI